MNMKINEALKKLKEDSELDLEVGNKYPVDDINTLQEYETPIVLSNEGKKALLKRIDRTANFGGKKPSEVISKYLGDKYIWKILPYGDTYGCDLSCVITTNEDDTSNLDDDALFGFGLDIVDLWDVMDLNEDVDLDLETADTYPVDESEIHISSTLRNKILEVLGINKEELPEHSPWARRLEHDDIKFLSWLSKDTIQKQWYIINKLSWDGHLYIYKKNDPTPDGLSSGSGVLAINKDSVDLFLNKIGYTKDSIGLQEELDLEVSKTDYDLPYYKGSAYTEEQLRELVAMYAHEPRWSTQYGSFEKDEWKDGLEFVTLDEIIDKFKTTHLEQDEVCFLILTCPDDEPYNGGDANIIVAIRDGNDEIDEELDLDIFTPNLDKKREMIILKDEQSKKIFEDERLQSGEDIPDEVYLNCLHLSKTTGNYKDYYISIYYNKSESNYYHENCYSVSIISKDDTRDDGLGYLEGNAFLTDKYLKNIGLTEEDLNYIKSSAEQIEEKLNEDTKLDLDPGEDYADLLIINKDGKEGEEEISKAYTDYKYVHKLTFDLGADGKDEIYLLSTYPDADEWGYEEDIMLNDLWYNGTWNFYSNKPIIEEKIMVMHNIQDVLDFGDEKGFYDRWFREGRVKKNPDRLICGGDEDTILWGKSSLKSYVFDKYAGEEVEILKEDKVELDVDKSEHSVKKLVNTYYIDKDDTDTKIKIINVLNGLYEVPLTNNIDNEWTVVQLIDNSCYIIFNEDLTMTGTFDFDIIKDILEHSLVNLEEDVNIDLDVSNEPIKDVYVDSNYKDEQGYQDANHYYTSIAKKEYDDGEVVFSLIRGEDEYDEGLDIDLLDLWYDASRDEHIEEPKLTILTEVHNINDVINFGKEHNNFYDGWVRDERVLFNPTRLLCGGQKETIIWGENKLKDFTKEDYDAEVDIIKEDIDLEPTAIDVNYNMELLKKYIEGTDKAIVIDNKVFELREEREFDTDNRYYIVDCVFEFLKDGTINLMKPSNLNNNREEIEFAEKVLSKDKDAIDSMEYITDKTYDCLEDCITNLSQDWGWESYEDFMEIIG